VAPAFIEFTEDGSSGSFGFIAVQGEMDAFARWDHNHPHEFTLADRTVIIPVRWWDGEKPERSLDGAKARLGRLRPGEQFAHTFDLGDNWQHLCTVAPQRAKT
jgi:hypothetical protein